MDYNIDELEWKCLDCGVTAPPTSSAKGIIIPGTKLKAPQQQGGEMVTVTQPQPGAIIFSIGQYQIPLEPQFLYESFLYYNDLKTRIDYTDSFSAAIRDAMTYIWRKFCYAEAKPQAQGQALVSGIQEAMSG